MNLRSVGGERCGALVRTGEAQHRVPRCEEILNDGGANEASRAGNENTHWEAFPRTWGNNRLGAELLETSVLMRAWVSSSW